MKSKPDVKGFHSWYFYHFLKHQLTTATANFLSSDFWKYSKTSKLPILKPHPPFCMVSTNFWLKRFCSFLEMVNFAIFDDFDKKFDISNWIFHKIVKCLIGCETIRMGLLKNKEKDLCTKHLCIPPDYCKTCCSTKSSRPGKYLSAHTLVILL